MNLHISKSKNAESFYICKSFVKANGSTSSMIVRKLGTLEQLLVEHGPTREDVLAWAKNEVKIETEKYKREKEAKCPEYFRGIRAVCRHPAPDGGYSISRWPVFSNSWQQI